MESTDDVRGAALLREILDQVGLALPAARVTLLLRYLEHHPRGSHNRAVAEAIEHVLDQLPRTELRASLVRRFRSLREPLLPSLEEPPTVPPGC